MADAKVLEAQKWVNRTYGGVSGYQRCAEDGQTGWGTMYSLTMGLQHELGISPLAAAFGPTTLARLISYGTIKQGHANANMNNLVQYALFCKGYWGGDGDGVFGAATRDAVIKITLDMGAPDYEGRVTPKLFKALLTMDAYVVLAGGTDAIRTIQQWLNRTYLNKSTFFIGPCDGHYSRDVQTALMKAIQYEIGIPEDQANGNFGAGTQAGLRANTLAQGDTGTLVRLFSAACVFNQPVLHEGGPYRTEFKDTYDAALTEFVKAFQGFSILSANGRADYPTWAQLLVSTGDPERDVDACDTRFTITASRARALAAEGYKYVGRYIYDPPGSTLDKEIQPGELDNIFGNDLRVFPIYQDNARQLGDFSHSTGYRHAREAHERAVGYGFNRGTVIYFAADYDATDPEITSNIIPYFQGVAAGLASKGKRYVHGVYGSRNVCARITDATYARWSFVSGMSWGFSGNLGFPLPANWAFNQIKEFRFPNGSDSFDLDNNAHRPKTDEGQGSVDEVVSPSEDFITYVRDIYAYARDHGRGNPNRLVMEYLRHRSYDNVQWTALIGSPDRDFIAYATARGARWESGFVDSSTGQEMGIEHLMATCNGHFQYPQPADAQQVNHGDVAGWGGDLITFYAEWQRDRDSYASGYQYCVERMAKTGIPSTFGYSDLLEDADGYLIAQRVSAGLDIATAVLRHYESGGSNGRFRDYRSRRFGSKANTQALARNILTTNSPVIAAGRTFLIQTNGGPGTTLPDALPESQLNQFLAGFTDVLHGMAG
ncbi:MULTISPECIES: glycoside hydrolase domain-containing protein [unclassified Streptomyces]|uniref:glycoside hydrolase domain-containing protein n=1 Tax=unclassified Streptomyces TaxID=2593676 RepID=UPI000932604E|nr:glycoside hydrolase domain-containing protein [Streptomyces sp. NBRC 110465]